VGTLQTLKPTTLSGYFYLQQHPYESKLSTGTAANKNPG